MCVCVCVCDVTVFTLLTLAHLEERREDNVCQSLHVLFSKIIFTNEHHFCDFRSVKCNHLQLQLHYDFANRVLRDDDLCS